MTWSGLIETGREMIVAYIKKQEEELPRPEVIEHEGKTASAVARATCAAVCFGLRPDAVSTRRLRHAGNATPGGGAVGRETRHAGERYVVSVAEVERHAVREGIVPGIADHAAGASSALLRRSTAWKTWSRRRPSMPRSTSSSRNRLIRRRRRRSWSPRAIAKACRCDRSMRRGRSEATTCRAKETAEEGREERPEADGVCRRRLLGGPVSSHGRGCAQRDPSQRKAGTAAQAAEQATAGRLDSRSGRQGSQRQGCCLRLARQGSAAARSARAVGRWWRSWTAKRSFATCRN